MSSQCTWEGDCSNSKFLHRCLTGCRAHFDGLADSYQLPKFVIICNIKVCACVLGFFIPAKKRCKIVWNPGHKAAQRSWLCPDCSGCWKQILLLPYVFSEHWKPMWKLCVSHNLLVAGSGKRRKTGFGLLNLKQTWKVPHVWGAAAQHNVICCKQVNRLEREGCYGCELGTTPFGLELEAQLFSVSQLSFSHFTYVASFLVPYSCLPAFLHAYFRKSAGWQSF